MKVALVDSDGRVKNVVDVPDEMVIVEPGKFFLPPDNLTPVVVTEDAGAVIGGTYDGERFGPVPTTLEDKIGAMLRDVAQISPNGEAAAIIAAERQG